MPDIYTVVQFVVIVVVSGVCGGLARAMFGLGRDNFLLSVVFGTIGGYLGLYLHQTFFPAANLPSFRVGSQTIEIVWIMIGAIVFTFVASLVDGARRRLTRRQPSAPHQPQ
ncbi:MAG: hypothetical protein HC837_01470 [Chloroflexaceae bacterium]|nr:hypothetical protein [Chloroflexaceae bacterium]